METPVDTPEGGQTSPVWRFLFEPRWILWHVLVVAAFWGMLWLGDWQFHRALSGNGLSWAYTFEWPLFSGFSLVFWARTVRDEFRQRRGVENTAIGEAALVAAAGAALPAGRHGGLARVVGRGRRRDRQLQRLSRAAARQHQADPRPVARVLAGARCRAAPDST
jgi:hypothetical protein